MGMESPDKRRTVLEFTGEDMWRLTLLTTEDVVANWDTLVEFFKPLRNTSPVFMIEDDVIPALRAESMECWAITNELGEAVAVILTTVQDTARHSTFVILWACGEIGRALPLLEQLEYYATRARCDSMQVCGRRGWIRALAPYGYRLYGMELRKMLTPITEH